MLRHPESSSSGKPLPILRLKGGGVEADTSENPNQRRVLPAGVDRRSYCQNRSLKQG